jgi:glycine betaine/choline ABC-type transport system substrate-binding protein
MRALAGGIAFCLWLCAAPAQAQVVRFAASQDCAVNAGCIPGLKSVYGLDPTSVFTPLAVAGSGIDALDDGVAEVGIAFSSNPQVSRPDIVSLRDDRHMLFPDHIVPVVRKGLLRAYSSKDRAAIRRRLNAASSVLTTLALRQLNQSVIDGRLPEAVGGEFVDANGLGGTAKRRHGPRIDIGFQSFSENETLAQMYAEALRSAGFRVSVRDAGLRPATVRAFRRKRIDMWPGYSGSLLRYLVGTDRAAIAKGLRHQLARIGGVPMRPAPAQDRNVYVMKNDVSAQLGVTKISDLAKYWPKAQSGGSGGRQPPGA